MAKISPPPLQMPSAFVQDKEISSFFDQLLRVIYQMWVELFDIRTKARTTTTNATPTSLQFVTIDTNRSIYVEASVVARRTGGSAGTTGDSAFYKISGGFKNIAGTVTQVGSTVTDSGEDQAGWNCAFVISGASVVITGTGAANNNITWESSVSYHEVGA